MDTTYGPSAPTVADVDEASARTAATIADGTVADVETAADAERAVIHAYCYLTGSYADLDPGMTDLEGPDTELEAEL